MKTDESDIAFALCIDNRDCEDLEKGKVYQVLDDKRAIAEGYLRIIDGSAEAYLYPSSYFVALDLPKKARDALTVCV